MKYIQYSNAGSYEISELLCAVRINKLWIVCTTSVCTCNHLYHHLWHTLNRQSTLYVDGVFIYTRSTIQMYGGPPKSHIVVQSINPIISIDGGPDLRRQPCLHRTSTLCILSKTTLVVYFYFLPEQASHAPYFVDIRIHEIWTMDVTKDKRHRFFTFNVCKVDTWNLKV